MIITFSTVLCGGQKIDLESAVVQLVDQVSVSNYRLTWKSDSPVGNLVASVTWAKGRRVRFTIETRDAWKHGSRTSARGRHMRKASWQAHYDVMQALFRFDRYAVIKTAFATYRGIADFEAKAPATAEQNVGSRMEPTTIAECSI